MNKFEINVNKLCPHLKKDGGGPKIVMIPSQRNEASVHCPVGSRKAGRRIAVESEIVADRMFTKKGPVEVSCEGCPLLPNGFKTTVVRDLT